PSGASPAGLRRTSPRDCPRLGGGAPHRVSLLSDPGLPRHRRAGPETSRLSYRLSGEGKLVRVRTYGFPGCFTRPPGTSTRHHPHEPTTSKPVVPGHAYEPSLAPPGGAIREPGRGALRRAPAVSRRAA